MNIDNNEYMDNTHNTRGALARLFTRNTGAASAAGTAGTVTSLKNAHNKRGERSPISAKKSWKGQRSTAMSTTRTSGRQLSERQGSGMSRRGRRFVAAVTALMLALPTMTGMFGFNTPAYADDLTNTVPNNNDGYETIDGADFYSDTIATGFVPNNYTTGAVAGPSYGPYTVPGVLQSQSTTSPTSFAAGLPLGTIFIDQKKVSGVTPIYKVVSDKTAIIAGLGVEQMSDGLTMGYDGTKTGAIKMVPGKINKLDGDLFTVKYEDAAILPNGERADLVITYSNAQIVIDQRYLAAPDGTQYYELITPKRDTAIAYRDNYGTNAWQNPALLTPLAGETFGGNPVFTDAGGYKYVRITASNGENRYYAIQDFGSDPVDLDPSSLSRVANKTHNYRGTEYPVFTDGTKEYILPDEQYYHGSVGLARGNLVARSGTDFTRFRNEPYLEQTRKIVNDTISSEFGDSYIYGSGQDGSTNQFPVTGTTLDVSYKIVNKDGTPAAGTFVFAVAGVNLDRDPDTGTSGNNVGRPLWYSYADDFEGGAGKEHSFFSEALEILDGQVSDYVYVRPNNNLEDNPDKITGVKGQYFWPNVSLHDGNIKFIGNQINTPSLGGNDNSYNAGFVTLANAATGFKIRHTGHGGAGGGMNSGVFESKQIWYRYTESTGKHGSIAVTSEGNFGGTLDDGGAVYKPEGTWDKGDEWGGSGTPSGIGEAATHVVAEGKTVTYTMTPDIGYKISKLWIGDQWNDDQSPIKYREITFDGDAIAAMKKGDTQEITTAAGNKGLLTYNEDGTYTLTFEYAQHHEAVHVEWEPTTADILVAKVWDDKDDKDGLRAAAYANEATKPKFKLQMSLNRGATWTDVTSNNFMNGVDIHPQTAITEQTVPSGLDSTSNKYLDGTYPINNDPNKDSTDPDVVQHPYTWEYLPVYTYDENGVADKIVLYRIVEEPDPAVSDYKKAQYFNSQSFELTSSKAQSVDGWLILEDSTDGKKYVKKGDGQYYEVDANGNASDTPATNQPKAANLGGVSSNQYYTVDKGIPYIAVQAKNEHEPREVYIELTKFWNDESIKGLRTKERNEYGRKDLTFVLHGETDGGPVDLNGDAEGTDREISITIVGDDAENDVKADVTGDKVVEGYTIYKDAQDTEYALVKGHATYEDGYYPVSGETIDYENGPVPGLSGLTPVAKGDGTYKIDDDHFGALIEHLSTHEAGKPITYTVTEKIDGKDANSSELAWTTTGGNLTPVKNDSDETIGYTTEFINTPVIDKDITPLPLTIQKLDKLTGVALENATFTVYTNVVSKTKATEYGLEKIDGQQVYTNDISKYVKKSDNKYYEVGANGTVATEAANPQPDTRTLKESYAGGVDDNEVITNDQGSATINFREPGTYYVVETKAPNGYNVDGNTYTFVVDEELKSVVLKSADDDHDTGFWEAIYDLLFNTALTTEEPAWNPDNGTLTVKDDPIRANILINKVWDDNNDQDGLRKNATELPKVKLQKTTDPTDENSWADVDSQAIPAPAKTIPDHDAPLIVDQDNYYTWDNLPAYENGKLITYRVIEFGGTVNSGAFLPQGDHPEETAYAWTAKTAVGDETDFNIANITDPDNPTSRNRTVTVTNKHIPGKVKLNVSKHWADDEGVEDQRRAANLTLYKTVNGAESVVETIDGVVPLTDQSNFKTWDNLPAFENGYPVTYRVVESAIGQYDTTYTKNYDTDNGAVNQADNSVPTSEIKRTWDADRNETTEATITIRNANLRNLTVSKTWINGANSNITYKLYRTTSNDPDVIDWERAKEAGNTGVTGSPSVNDPTQTLYNWTPDSNWEEVTGRSVDFSANRFTTSTEGDTESEILEGLPKADANGNTYIYRVWEEVDPSRYEANQTSNTTVVNTNIHAENGYANVNVVKELQGRDWAKSDDFTDRFYFTIEPYADDGSIYNNASAYGVDANGDPITDPNQVPMPMSGNTIQGIADVDKDDIQVGAIGRNVAFNSIEYTVSQVDMGQTAEYYYKVYEVYDANGTSLDDATRHTGKRDGITYAGTVENGTFKPTVHTLKVVVSSDAAGKITTALFWDKNTTQSAVPVYTNTYDSSAEVHAHVIKKVQGREITGDDAFNFTITNMAGAPMRSTENGTANTTSQSHNAGTITENSGSKVQAGAGGYDPVDGEGGNYRAMRSDSSTWIKVSDLAQRTDDGRATDTFIYRLVENAGNSVANDDDLTFDDRHIYLKVVATDNLDGSIKIEKSYWYDETCNSDPVDAKVLTAKVDGSLAPEGSSAGDVYDYEPAAIFTNSQTIDIPVVKEWKDAPAVEDVTLRLQRKLIPLSAEAGLTYSGVESAAGDWKDVGNMTAKRGDFVNDDGTPKYEGSTTTASATYENIAGFNKDLPKYVTENGTTYRAVYKLVEDNTSDAYDTTYRSEKGGTPTAGNQIFIDGETLVVTNTVTASNEANIAAVKQLLGRQWLDSDDFEFTLEPAGKGTYNADGSFKSVDSSTDAKATVPMPEDDTARKSETKTDPTRVAITHAWDEANNENSIVVDQNGDLERLARFGAIKFDINDLKWVNNHYEGDFFYTMKEKVPEDATDNGNGTYTKDGITYDTDSHTVHVKVQGNRSAELYVQIAYDEKTVGDTSTGTQFTPVYTNRYDAVGTQNATINKYIMGRDFKNGETFTFKATPLGDTPMVDAASGNRLESLERTLTVSDPNAAVQSLILPAIKFILEDLPWTVGANGATDARDGTVGTLKYSDNTTPVAGMKYGRFMYAFTEKSASATDLNLDPDTEYVQVTVIDKGDGTLDTQVAYFEDRYGTIPRYTPNEDGTPSTTPATATVFVNKLKRDLDVTKVWTNPATSDVTLRLQWSTNGTDWNDADGTSWLADVKATQTIPQGATSNELTVTFEDLPAYVNSNNDDIDLNDTWVYYRVVEDAVADTDTRYSTTEIPATAKLSDYATGHTEDDVYTEAEDAADSIDHIWVGNFPKDLEGTASVHVVKQLIGRGWTDTDNFTFQIAPKESKKGNESAAVPYDADDTERTFPMPAGANGSTNTATATTRSTPVTVGEYNATFDNITIKLSDLKVDPADNVAKGWFTYTITEPKPEGATEVIDTSTTPATKYWVKDNVKYTTETHEVTIYAQNDGNGVVATTVSYDGRPAGDFVPVYTNEAVVPTPIEGSKTWVGGEASERVNANEGVDARGITLQRKTSADADWTALTQDDLGRTLKVKWSADSGDATFEIMAINPDQPDSTADDYLVPPVLDMMDDDGYKYEYRIIEGSVPDDYAVTYATTGVTNNDITNTSTKKDSLKVTKTWNDEDNAEGLRPDKVVMHLYKQVSGSNIQVEVDSKEILKGAERTGITWGDLPVYDKDGNKITYVVIEENEFGYTTTYKVLSDPNATGYDATTNSLTLDGNTTAEAQTIDVKNTLEPATDSLSVTKVWNDDNDRDGNRPDSVSVNVYKHVWDKTANNNAGAYVKNDTPVDTLMLDATGNWRGTMTDLPRTENGRTVFYTVGEDVSDTNVFGAAGTEGKYSNTPLVTGSQTEGFTVTNNYTPETIDIQATKVWGDLALQLLKPFGYDRPTTVSFQLKADGTAVGTPVAVNKDSTVGTTEWAYQWADLPKYKNGGTEIAYTVEELPVPGYTSTVTGNMADGFTVTNTVKKNDVTVTKQFLDADTGQPIPTSSIPADFVIHANYTTVEEDDNGDMVRVVKDVQLKIADATGPSTDGTYTWTLENVVAGTTVHVHENNYQNAPKYNFDTVTTTVTNANADIHTDDANFTMPVISTTGSGSGGSNSSPDPSNNTVAVRPSIGGGAGGIATSAGLANVTLELPRAVHPGEGGAPDTADGDVVVQFVNKYTKQTADMDVVKMWNDDNNSEGLRPETLTLRVSATANGQPYNVFDNGTKSSTDIELDSLMNEAGANKWSYLMEDLPIYDDAGNLISYSVTEPTVPEGYTAQENPATSTLTADFTASPTFVNTRTPVKDRLTVTKVWDDDNNAAGLRPNSVTFHLYKTVGGADVSAGVASKTVNATGDWTATWTNLPVYENGEKITYKVVEEAVAGYETTYSVATVQLDGETTREATQEDVDAGNAENVGDPIAADPQEVTVTNTLAAETDTVTITKVWNDADDVDGKRPDSVEMKVFAYVWNTTSKTYEKSANAVATLTLDSTVDDSATGTDITVQETEAWKGIVRGLPAVKNGKAVLYTVDEDQITGYEVPVITGDQINGFTVTNTHVPTTTTATVTKSWSDNNNASGTRPDAVTMHLYKKVGDADPVDTGKFVTLSADDNWTHTMSGLPTHELVSGESTAVSYFWKEDVPEGYSASSTDPVASPATITNTVIVDDLTVTKEWYDSDNAAGLRPNSVIFHLYKADGTSAGVDAKTVSGNGSARWENLPVYDKNGDKITYKVVEEAVAGYTTTYAEAQTIELDGVKTREATQEDVDAGNAENVGDSIAVAPQAITVTNELLAATTSVSVTKVWDDDNNVDGTRPDSVEVNVYEYVWDETSKAYAKNDTAVDTLTLNATGNWTGTKTNLPATKNGKTVMYSVAEERVEGYGAPVVTGNQVDGFTVTNKRAQDTVSVTVNKTWVNDNATYRPDHVVYTLKADGTTATDVNGNAVSPATALGSNYGAVFSDLPKNKLVEGRSTPIVYTVEETPLPGYTTTYATPVVDAATGNTTIAVTNTAKLGTLFVTKKWSDEDNRDGKRPTADEFVSKLSVYADGKQVTLTGAATDNGDGTFIVAYTGVPVYNAANQPITYMVSESGINGYTQTGTLLPATTLSSTSLMGTVQLSNTYEPEKTDVSFTKQWNDASNQDGERPSTDEFADMLALTSDSGDDVSAATPTVVDNGDNTFTVTYSDLYKYRDQGTPIVYTLTETLPNGSVYTADTATTTSESGADPLKNSYTPETTTVKVTKVWDDEGNQDGKRPQNVTVRLLADGTEVASAHITEGEFTFTKSGVNNAGTELPKKKNGVDIVYTVTEDAVVDYQQAITGDAASGYTITNSYEPGTTTVTVTKVWDDADNQDGLRPPNVTIKLLADGTEVASTTIAGGSYTFTTDSDGDPLPAKKNGTDIVYTVSEEQVTDYNAPVITGDATTGFTVTNTHAPATTSASVTKVWVDDNNADRLRPDNVTFQLYKTVGGTTVAVPGKTITLATSNADANDANKWAGTIDGLPEKENGQAITYTFKEVDVPAGYSATTSADGLTITNTHERYTGCVEAVKVWDDDNNREGKRTDVTFTLKADGQPATYAGGTAVPAETISVNTNTPQAAAWHNVPVNNEAGEKITYTVEEATIAGYTTTYSPESGVKLDEDGDTKVLTVTNKYTPAPISVTATKVWDDENNKEGLRDDVTLHLKGAVAGSNVTLTFADQTVAKDAAGDDLTVTWDNLPAYHDGKAVTYTVSEEALPGYTATVTGNQTSGFTVTNKRTPAVTSVTVTKVWNDADNQDGLRSNVTVYLDKTVDGTTTEGVDSTTLAVGAGHEQGMTATWDDLPAYENGKQVTYTVREKAIEGYTTQITGDAANGFTITNTHTPETTSVTATKVWNDAALMNGDTPIEGYDRPKTVSLQLKADGTAVGSPVAVSKSSTVGDTEWAHQWTALPKYKDGGTEIKYTVGEAEVPYGYSAAVTGNMADGFTVTNTPKVSEVLGADLVVKKLDKATGKAMEGVTFRLRSEDVADFTPVAQMTNDGGVATFTFDKEGTYTLTETIPTGYEDPDPESYTITVSKDGTSTHVELEPSGRNVFQKIYDLVFAGGGANYDATAKMLTVENTPKTNTVTVRKQFVDADTRKPIPGSAIPADFAIHADYTVLDENGVAVEKTATLKVSDALLSNGTYKWTLEDVIYGTDVHVHEMKYINVTGYDFTSTEVTAPDGSKIHEDDANFTMSDAASTVSFVNEYTKQTGDLELVKNWSDDSNRDGARPTSVEFTVTASAPVFATAEGATDTKTVTLTGEATADSWSDTSLTGLPLYYNDEKVTYTVDEAAVADYTKAIDQKNGVTLTKGATSTLSITNSHLPETTTVDVAKVWDDADNQDGKRPEKVTFRLFANGEDTGKTVTLSTTDVTADDANRWVKADAFTVPSFDDAGTPIKYTVREDVSRELATAGYTDSGEAGADKDYTIKNTYTPGSGEVLGDETWGGINEQQTGEIDWKVNPKNHVTPGSLVAPEGATTNDDGSVTVTGGTYKLNADGTVTFTPADGFVGDPTPITVKGTDKQGNTVTATYIPHVVNNVQTDEVKRTITYSYAADGSQAADPVTQTVSFTRTGTVNPDNGEVTFKDDGSDWTVVGDNPDAANFPAVDSPDIEGYNPDRASVNAVTVKPGDEDITEKVVYKDGDVVLTPREITVLKVDSITGNPLPGAEFTLSDPYGNPFPGTTGEDGKVTFSIDAKGGWTLVETGVPENHKLSDVYSWTIVAKADGNNVTIEKVTEGEETFWKKIMEVIVDFTPDGFDEATNMLTVGNPPIDEKTITYVDPDPEDPTKEKEVLSETIKVSENEPGQPADPTRDGYEFGGWLREMDKDGNVIYKANWIKIPEPGEKVIQYVDPSKPEGEQTVLHDVITRGEDEPAQPADPTREGWKFTGWKRTIDDDGNVTYTATWEEIPGPERVEITYDPANGEKETTVTINRNENEPGQPADPTRDGFTFMGWDRVEDENGNVTYKARWKEIPASEKIKVTYDFDNGETARETTIERGEDEPAQPADPTREGYTFGGWIRTMDENGNVTYKARWIKVPDPTEKITITRDPGNGQPPTVTEIERGQDEPGQPGDPMRDGYEFMGWDRTVDTETGNVIYKARWKKLDLTDAITITYDPANGESSSSTTIERGTNEPGQPEPPTRDGYIFGGWLRTFDEDGNVTYTANWIETTIPAPEKITVTYDFDNGTDPEVSTIERGENEPGQPETPTRDGYIFGGWLRTQDDAGNVIYKARWIDSTMCPVPTPTPDPNDSTTPGGDPTTPGGDSTTSGGTPGKTPTTPEVSERPLSAIPLSNTGEAVGTAGMAALMLALLGGGLLTLRRQRVLREE